MSKGRMSVTALIIGLILFCTVVALPHLGFSLFFPQREAAAQETEGMKELTEYLKSMGLVKEKKWKQTLDQAEKRFQELNALSDKGPTVYRITPVEVKVAKTFHDGWGKPEPYLEVILYLGRPEECYRVIKTFPAKSGYTIPKEKLSSGEITGSIYPPGKLIVSLWDEDLFEDDLICEWHVRFFPTERLKNLSSSDGSVKFKVEVKTPSGFCEWRPLEWGIEDIKAALDYTLKVVQNMPDDMSTQDILGQTDFNSAVSICVDVIVKELNIDLSFREFREMIYKDIAHNAILFSSSSPIVDALKLDSTRLLNKEDAVEAIAEYKKALETDPDNAEVHKNLGNAYFKIWLNTFAIDEYSSAIQCDPDNAGAHNNLAIAYYCKEEYILAIKHCVKAIELGYRVHPGFLKELEPYRKK